MAIIFAACGPKSVEEQAEAWFEQIVESLKDGDLVKAQELFTECYEWNQTLSAEDQEKVENVGEKYAMQIASIMGLADETEPVEYEAPKQDYKKVTAKAKDYCEQIVKALKKGNFDKAEDLLDDFDDWQASLDDDEWDAAEDVWESYEDVIDGLFEEIDEW